MQQVWYFLNHDEAKVKIQFEMFTILFVVLSLVAGSTYAVDPPAMEWHKGHGTSYGSHVHEGFQTSDGGYIGIGQTWDSSDDYPEMLVIKTYLNGNKEWQKVIGTSGQPDIGICIAEVSDGFICGGGLYDSGNMKRALVKLNKTSGNIVSGWPKYYSGSQNCAIRGVDILGDGSIVATGYTNCPEEGFVFIVDDGTGFIMKTDADGNVIWDKGLTVPQGTKVRQDGSGFAVCSTAWYFDGGDHMDAVLIKTDSSGNQTNKYHYGGTGGEHCYDFDLTSDGGYILGGHTTSYGVANWDYYLVKVNSSGTEQWHKTFGQPRGYNANYIHDEAYGVRQTPDGGYIIVGGSGDEHSYSACGHPAGCSDEWKAYLVKTDGSGNKLWEDVYPPTSVGNTAGEYLGLTSDGGYIVFTDTDAFWGTIHAEAMGFMKIARDTATPTPDPMTWAIEPHVNGPDSVSMTATTAFDPNDVQYYFACTAGDCNDSGWQDSTFYEDTGLSKDIRYAYTVRVRDKGDDSYETEPSNEHSTIIYSSDFDLDGDLDVEDLSFLGLYWLEGGCAEPNWCDGTDLNFSTQVNLADFAILSKNCPFDPNLVGYWRLDGDATDSSIQWRDGTCYGSLQWVPNGYLDGALEFDGSSVYVKITGYKGISGSKSRTVATWIKTNTASAQDIVSWGKQATGQWWVFYIDSSGNLRVAVSGANKRTTGLDLLDGAWHHVAAVLPDGSSNIDDVKLYINGQEQTSISSSSQTINTAGSDDVTIGVYIGRDRYFDGLIDDVRIYNRAMDEDEIATLAGL